jgi:UDP-GlcNAc:undecaprenyl-phosphate GlcNAc-1-phosphate transferase
MHQRPVPVSGGLAVLAAGTLATAAVLVFPGALREELLARGQTLLGLLLAGAAICAVGVADDCGRLRARHKLLGQCVAVGIVMSFGVIVRSLQLFGWYVELDILAVPFTAFLLLGAINSLNLLDGMDGLLGSVGVIVSLSLAIMAALAGQWAGAVAAAALAGGLLGFLRYNLPPASIFLGDSGSMLVGLVVGTLAIQSSLKAPATVALVVPFALLILPIFDTTAAILRRKLTGRSIYTTDRGHLHHCLLRRGLSVWSVLLLVSCFSAAAALGVLTSQAFNNEWIALLTGLAVVGTLIITRLFGYAEVVLVKERLRALLGILLGRRSAQPHQIEVRLQGSADWQVLWVTLTATAARLNLKQVRLDVNAPALHEGYHARWDRAAEESEAPNLWRAEIPLSSQGLAVGRLEIAAHPDAEPVWRKIATVTRIVEDFENAAASLECGCSDSAVASHSPAPKSPGGPGHTPPELQPVG